MGKLIDFLYNYHFKEKYKNPYTEKAMQTIFYSNLYKLLNSDKIQENNQQKDMIKKMRGF